MIHTKLRTEARNDFEKNFFKLMTSYKLMKTKQNII